MASNNPYVIEQQQSQQQQNFDPMGFLSQLKQLQGGQSGGLGGLMGGGAGIGTLGSAGSAGGVAGAGSGVGSAAGLASGAGGGAGAGIASVAGGATSGAAAGGSGAGAGASALASNPVGWVIAAALAQNVMHNKGISSWGDALKGTSGRKAGEHFQEQWGVDGDSTSDKAIRGVMGLGGFGSSAGVLNPSYLPNKLFG